MAAKPIQAFRNTFIRYVGMAGLVLAVFVVNAPVLAQQVHGTGSNRGKAQHISAPYSPNQMTNMLDQIETGKSPNLPPHTGQQLHQNHSVNRTGQGVYPGTVRTPVSSMMGHGMGMGAMGHGMGMGAMGTMGGGAGAGMTGGGAAQFMQQLKQKLSSMQPQEGAGGESPGSAAGGGGMQAQLMQHLFQGQSAPGAMGGAPTGHFGTPMARPSRGMGMGMAPMMQSKAPMQQFSPDSVIKRPPGISGITGGAPISSPPRGGPAASTASDLERQMEQQYGH